LDGGRKLIEKLQSLGIELDAVTDELLTEGVAAFAQSFEELLANLEEKQRKVGATG
jgi:transaldolase/glucose-6-phosphate isomerase